MGFAAALIDLLAPDACAVCRAPGEALCGACLGGLAWMDGPRCGRCGHPTPVPAPRCPECIPGIAWAAQACVYGDAEAVVLGALKDRGRRPLAAALARAVVARCPPPPGDAVLVPVPLTPARRARRGFNQSALLAHQLGSAWGNPVGHDLLSRVRDGSPQRGSGSEARRRQVAGAFEVRGPIPERVWLVDDVITTGATLRACAHPLRTGGARLVGAVAFARVAPAYRAIGGRPARG